MTDSSNRTSVVGTQVVTTPECRTIHLDLSEGATAVVFPGAALLRMVNVNADIVAEVSFLNGDEGNPEDFIAAGMTAGYWAPYGDAYYPQGIYLTCDESETGDISVKYVPLSDNPVLPIEDYCYVTDVHLVPTDSDYPGSVAVEYLYFGLNPQSGTSFEWETRSVHTGDVWTPIVGADSSVLELTGDLVDGDIRVTVTPRSVTFVGDPVVSDTGTVTTTAAYRPTQEDVEVTGTYLVGNTLTLSFTYVPDEATDSPESEPYVEWWRADDDTGTNEELITSGIDAALLMYQLQAADEGKYVAALLRAQNSNAILASNDTKTAYTGPVVV